MKVPTGMTPSFDWVKFFEIDKYTVWSKVDSDTNLQIIFQITEGKKPESDGGYYHLGPMLTMKNL
jgi:hypothetical protein